MYTAVFFLAIVFFAGATSCTSTSQVPLSFRQQQETEADTLNSNPSESEAEEAERRRLEDESLTEEEERRRQEEEEALRRQLEAEFEERASEALSFYVRAQTAFFNGNYNRALDHIRQAMDHLETADIYALAGSIFQALGRTDEAAEYWQRAVERNPEVVSEMYPGMETWYEEDDEL